MSQESHGAGERVDPDRLEEVYERARALDPAARPAFLADACRGDSHLERELNSLLAHGERAEAFFATLAEAVVSPAVGHRIGHYELVGILGTGGMGTVYRAHDTRLDRVVALKFLPPYLSAHPEARERFLVEARAAAALEHPNVCSIHEIGETADKRPFIAMSCYEGETLEERLRRGPLPSAEAGGIALQLARGLAAAHARGIVHRDVKPGNIMLCADGTVRLLDFGLAKVADVSLTGPGVTPGTIAYMSPEQARGDPVDPRTDLWSLGVVLYEMLSGMRPFRGGNDRVVIQAILHEQPESLERWARHVPPSLSRVVERLLRKPPPDRYQNTGDLLGDLERGAPVGGVTGLLSWARSRTGTLAVSGAALLAAVVLLTPVWPGRPSATGSPASEPGSQPPTIAVLPFTVRGPGLDVWHEGMVDLLSMGLDGAAGIRAVDSRTLLARWHREIGNGTRPDLALALGVARRTEARYALVGSAVAAGSLIRLAADVYDVGSGRVVGPVQVEGSPDSVLALVDRLGMQTLGVILEKDPGEVPALDLAGVTTTSLIALKAYLDGNEHYRRSEFREASTDWERAVRADTLFALAYLGLADAYAWRANAAGGREEFENALERAWTMADRLPGRERTMVQMRWARYAAVPQAVTLIREATRKYPDAADAWYELGEAFFHDAVVMGGPEEAEEAFRKAADLQPTMAPYRVHLLDLAFEWHADSTHIARELESYAQLASEDARTRAGRVALALVFGDTAARARARSELHRLDPESATQVYLFLPHSRFAEVREAIFPVIKSRPGQRFRTLLQHEQLMNLSTMDGRVRDVLAILEDSTTYVGFRYCGPMYLALRGLPVPESILEQRFAWRIDSLSVPDRHIVTCAAWYATRYGDWRQHRLLLTRARETAARERAAGNDAGARAWDWTARVAEAHGLWRLGRKEDALQAFESTLAGDLGGWETLWYVGQLNLELGRLDRAERAFRALWKDRDVAPAALQRARILERMGRLGEAREAYQFFTDAWRQADPELQPLVSEARQAVVRLSRAQD